MTALASQVENGDLAPTAAADTLLRTYLQLEPAADAG
jgi:hypothetical protein